MANENEITIELVEQPDYIINLEKQGPAGLRGPQGEKGSQGDRGPQGEKGDTGEQGPSGTITLGNVATGLPGTDVIVTNTGTEENAIFNFTIPRGDVGPEGGTTFGIKGDYATHYGIEYCQYGLIENPVGTKDITVKGGMMLCVPGIDTKTTIGSDINYTIEASEDVTIFYAEGSILEVLESEVYYSTEEPIVTTPGYTAWWNPQVGTWKFISADTGNVWREANATPLADIKIADNNITRIDYIGYRVLNDDIYGLKSEVATINLDNLTEEGEKHFLNKSQITNCLLEVPQRIKLELNGGTLTLKAGSKVIVPNGFEADGTTPKFDEVVIESDYSISTDTGTPDGQHIVYIGLTGTKLHHRVLAQAQSGTTEPTNGTYYNTATNIITAHNNSGDIQVSLPVGIISFANGEIISIDQVFNGMGYIGSTTWIDKGVKMLLANGRNADGTLNNTVITTDKMYVRTMAYSGEQSHYVFWLNYTDSSIYATWGGQYIVSETEPNHSDASQYIMWYNPVTNLFKQSNAGGEFFDLQATYIGICEKAVTGNITQFKPKEAFRAVDYSEYVNTPRVIETYVNGTSWYRVWSDGWKEQGGRTVSIPMGATATVTLMKAFTNANYTVNVSPTQSTNNYANPSVYNFTVNTFVVMNISNIGSNCPMCWYACGY